MFCFPTLDAIREGTSSRVPTPLGSCANMCVNVCGAPLGGVTRKRAEEHAHACRWARRGTKRGAEGRRSERGVQAERDVQEHVCSCALGPALGPAGAGNGYVIMALLCYTVIVNGHINY